MNLTFEKKKEYLICVDSDGCVIDGMTVKHVKCFGPCMIEEFNLEEHEDELLEFWNEINLYSITRGINRFKGLLIALEDIQKRGYLDMDIAPLRKWIETTSELSNRSIEAEMKINQSIVLEKALSWSNKVNQSVSKLSDEDKKAFNGVMDCFIELKKNADLAVVSSANAKAVEDEWKYNNILEYPDIIMTQEYGNKTDCLKLMIKSGYEPDHILMVGDSPGDITSAERAGVLYFPIMVGKEEASWHELQHEVLNKLYNGSYKGEEMIAQKESYEKSLMEGSK